MNNGIVLSASELDGVVLMCECGWYHVVGFRKSMHEAFLAQEGHLEWHIVHLQEQIKQAEQSEWMKAFENN